MSVSEMAEIKSILEKNNNLWESEYKPEVDKIRTEGKDNSEKLEKLDINLIVSLIIRLLLKSQ